MESITVSASKERPQPTNDTLDAEFEKEINAWAERRTWVRQKGKIVLQMGYSDSSQKRSK